MSKRRSDPNAERSLYHRVGRLRTNRVLYIAVESESTEPDYLDYLDYLNKEFGVDLDFVIHSLWSRNGLKPREVVEKALEHRGEGELWALFDRDEHSGRDRGIRCGEKGR